VAVDTYDGTLDPIRSQVLSLNVKWDLVDVAIPEATRGCKEGLFERIDPAILASAPDGTPASQDFIDVALQPCAVGSLIVSIVAAYDPARFPDEKPTSLTDFFDTKRFPGPRGMIKHPRYNLEWALMADGVPASEVYQVLSTSKGVDRAFKVLDRMRDDIEWFEDPSLPQDWLAEGRVVMSMAGNGRVFAAVKDQGANLNIIWDGQILDLKMWAVTKGAVNLKSALDFLVFATDSKRLAEQATYIVYGPARKSSEQFMPAALTPYLPTAEDHLKNALRTDYKWWAENEARLENRFDAWINKRPWRPNFHPADGN
jgi:putative spermidine/putrescine transport system substrate-binding protein